MKMLVVLFSCAQIVTFAATAQADVMRAWLFVEDRALPYDSVQITDRSGLQLESRQGYVVTNPVPEGLQEVVTTEVIAVPVAEPTQPLQPIIAGSLTVDFATNSANLKHSEKQKVENFLQQLDNTNVRGIKIAGFADPRGNASYNQVLSGKRAENVAKLFEKNGIDESMITVEAGGEVAASTLADSRIVEIVVVR